MSSPETAHLHKESFQSYWLAGLLSDFFFLKGLCTEYRSSSFTGLSHKLAPDPKTVTQNGGSSSRVAGIQASQ